MKVLVTGGSGFIGSHLIKELSKEHEVINYDIKEGYDILNKEQLNSLENIDCVFHLAADPDVKSSINPSNCFEKNVIGSYNVLEFVRKKNIKNLAFTSSCTVYRQGIDLKEDSPLEPVSNYGASKAAIEMFISSYSHAYGINATIVRFANVYGKGSTHGVMYDFYQKLKKNPDKLEILGNGLQKKSYIHVTDAVKGLITAWKNTKGLEVYNIGHDEWTSVNEIAKEIISALKLNPKISYTGGSKGWAGDISKIRLNINKIKSTGWKPEVSFKQGIKEYINSLNSLTALSNP